MPCRSRSCAPYEDGLYRFLETSHPQVLSSIAEKKILDDEVKAAMKAALEDYGKQFAAVTGAA